MKAFMTQSLLKILTIAMLGAITVTVRAADDPPVDRPQNSGTETNADEQQQVVGELIQRVIDAQQDANDAPPAEGENGKPADSKSPRPIRGQGSRGSAGSGTNAVSLTALVAKNSTNHVAGGTNLLRLNFRNAPLSMVLDYLSEAAGFTISPSSKVDLKGTVTVWSNQPVTRDQAVALLHKSLSEYNYAATVDGNMLNIYVIDASNTEIVAGVPDNDYTKVIPTKDLVTQIVYVHNVESSQLIQSLQPLMPSGTSMSANQGANAIVITDSKANIRRMVQLVKALDTASVSASDVRVFPLTYADATSLAQVVQQLFQADSSSSRDRSRFGGFPFGGFGGDRGGDRGSSSSSGSSQAGRVASAKVTAVADDRSNSLVVSASDDQMKDIENLVKQMDVNVDDVTELRVFRLRYADPQETADQLTTLFPDPTQQNANDRSRSRGFGFFGGFGRDSSSGSSGRSSGSAGDASSRKVRAARVTAVPDPRTGSVIVSAAHDLMDQISSIVEELDSDPAKKKKVYVIKVENRDPQEVVEDLQSVISSDSSGGNLNTSRNSSRQNGSQLNSRQQSNLQNQGNNNNNSFLNSNNTRRTGQ
jgi:hypothetical protein